MRPTYGRRDWWLRQGPVLAMALLTVLVFMAHFRPWQGGVLEEWVNVRDWELMGFSGSVQAQMLHWVGRPLSVFPIIIGLAISGGGFVGPFLMLGLFAVAQLWLAWWAIGSLISHRWLRCALSASIALAAWWEAGLLLRFIAPQFGNAFVLLWLGAAIRYLQQRSRYWLLAVVLAPIVTLLSYQAAAGSFMLVALVLALVWRASRGRRIGLVAATWAAVIASLAWTIVIAPLLPGTSYEAGSMDDFNPAAAVVTIGRTLLRRSPLLVLAGLALALLTLALMFRKRISRLQGGIVLAGLVASPLTALIFVTSSMWLADHERVVLPVGLTLWMLAVLVLALCFQPPAQAGDSVSFAAAPPLTTTVTSRAQLHWQSLLAAVLVASSLLGTAVGYRAMSDFALLQQDVMAVIAPWRERESADQMLLVEDFSGQLGGLYTFDPAGYLELALSVQHGQGTGIPVVICTPRGVQRQPTVATVDCEALTTFASSRLLEEVTVRGRHIRLYLVSQQLQSTDFLTPSRADIRPETSGSSQWWWIHGGNAEFAVTYNSQPFNGITGQVRAPLCGAQNVSLHLTGDSGGDSLEVGFHAELAPGQAMEFSLPLQSAVSQANLTVTVEGPGCRQGEDSRDLTVGLWDVRLSG